MGLIPEDMRNVGPVYDRWIRDDTGEELDCSKPDDGKERTVMERLIDWMFRRGGDNG